MMKTARILIAVMLVGIGLGSVLMLAGCEDEAEAGTSAARGAGNVPNTAPAIATPEESTDPPIVGTAEGQLETLAMSVDELVQNTAEYTGREVVVRGTILTQCIRGCQFSLDDGTGVIGIELVEEALENVLMRGSVGRIVEVRGIIEGTSRPLILVKDREGWRYVD